MLKIVFFLVLLDGINAANSCFSMNASELKTVISDASPCFFSIALVQPDGDMNSFEKCSKTQVHIIGADKFGQPTKEIADSFCRLDENRISCYCLGNMCNAPVNWTKIMFKFLHSKDLNSNDPSDDEITKIKDYTKCAIRKKQELSEETFGEYGRRADWYIITNNPHNRTISEPEVADEAEPEQDTELEPEQDPEPMNEPNGDESAKLDEDFDSAKAAYYEEEGLEEITMNELLQRQLITAILIILTLIILPIPILVFKAAVIRYKKFQKLRRILVVLLAFEKEFNARVLPCGTITAEMEKAPKRKDGNGKKSTEEPARGVKSIEKGGDKDENRQKNLEAILLSNM